MAIRIQKWRSTASKRVQARRVGLLSLIALVLVSGSALIAQAVVTTAPQGAHLVAVGPVSSETGYPESYTDNTGTRLELCFVTDPLCSAAPPLPDPAAPMSFPDNFADENFYSLVGAGLTTGTAGRATLTLAAEAAFANGPVAAGDQITFGRVRIKVSGLTPGAHYKVTHPYGVDEFDAESGVNNINFTEDIGIGAQGSFTGMLNSRIGPFLRWDTGAPAGYLGDPATDHKITGSPIDANYFRIEGPDAGGPGVNVVETDLFSVMGKKATNSGVEAVRATYSRPAPTDPPTTGGSIDVFATSEADQSLSVVSKGAFYETLLDGDGKRYFAHVDYKGDTPADVTVINGGDNPVATKTIAVTDLVTVTKALYDADANTLEVKASSSDEATPPTLTATGFGALSHGYAKFENVNVAPPDVTVTSEKGGSAKLPVQSIGAGFAPIPIEAFAGADQTVQANRTVTLDGSQSKGTIDSYSWAQTSGTHVMLAGADTATPTFTSPAAGSELEFELTVNGPGGPLTDKVLVSVASGQPPVADAGAAQTVPQGTTVKLDASASTNAASFAWTQRPGGTPVTLKGADTATPTFTFPRFSDPLTFEVTVTGTDGSTATASVKITGATDTLTAAKARYTASKREYDISGTASQLGANVVTVHLGSTLDGAVIGTAQVDPLTGAWRLRPGNAGVVPGTTRTISVESARGGKLLGAALQVQ